MPGANFVSRRIGSLNPDVYNEDFIDRTEGDVTPTHYNPKVMNYGQSKNVLDYRRRAPGYQLNRVLAEMDAETGDNTSLDDFKRAIKTTNYSKLSDAERDDLLKRARQGIKEFYDMAEEGLDENNVDAYNVWRDLIKKLSH
jgi:hypothetical protein